MELSKVSTEELWEELKKRAEIVSAKTRPYQEYSLERKYCPSKEQRGPIEAEILIKEI